MIKQMIADTAFVHESVELGENVFVGPCAVIGPNVVIGEGCSIGAHVVIKQDTLIGSYNTIHQFASVGGDPQIKNYKSGQTSYLKIGNHNVIHEYVTINRGALSAEKQTIVGDNNQFMAYSHVAHDCVLGNEIIMVNNSTLAGHVTVENFAILSAFTAVHQFCRVGRYSMLTKGCLVGKDVLPYLIVAENPPRVCGLNKIGLKRGGCSQVQIDLIKQAYKIIFKSELTLKSALDELKVLVAIDKIIQPMLSMIQKSERSIVRTRST